MLQHRSLAPKCDVRHAAAATAVIAVLVLTILASASAQPTPLGKDGANALAAQLVDFRVPPAAEKARIASTRTEIETSIKELSSAIRFPSLKPALLAQSIDVGTEIGLGRGRTILVDFYSRGMSSNDLEATVAFYSSPEGRAATSERTRQITRNKNLSAKWQRVVFKLPDEQVTLPPYQHTRAEGAFLLGTPAGRALAALEQTVDALATRAAVAESPVRAIEAEYCEHTACSQEDHNFFRSIALSIRGEQARAERDSFGERAGFVVDPQASVLARLACTGDQAAVAAAVRKGANPNALALRKISGREQATTPLLWATDCGNSKGIEALLAAGADPNAADEFGITPVTFAADLKRPMILKQLLNHGGNPNAYDEMGSALQHALSVGNDLQRIDRAPDDKAWANWNALIAAGADINAATPRGGAVMIDAAKLLQWAKVAWLMDHGWRGDPVELGRSLEMAEELNRVSQDQRATFDQIRAELIRRGVKFPVGGLGRLKRDSRGHYVQ
jgi:uncharacterized protein